MVIDSARELEERRVDVAEVGRVRPGLLRGADADEMDVGERRGLVEVGREVKQSRVLDLAQLLRQSRFEERDPALGERADLVRIDVDAEHVVPERRHADGMGRAEVAGSDHGDLRCHGSPSLSSLSSSGARLVAEASRGPGRRVVAAHGVAARGLQREPVAGAVHLGGVAAEDVVRAPAVHHLVGLESVARGVDADVALDEPAVALDVDPGVRVALSPDPSKVLSRTMPSLVPSLMSIASEVVPEIVLPSITLRSEAVGLAVGDVAPVALGGADVDAFAELVAPDARCR